MKRIAILAPVYIDNDAHLNFAQDTMDSIVSKHQIDKIAIINKIRQNSDDEAWIRNTFDYVETNNQNILARAWNRGIKIALERGAQYVIVINLDLLIHKQCIDNLIEFADSNQDAICWSGYVLNTLVAFDAVSTVKHGRINNRCHFSCFMVDHRLLHTVGEFDEQFAPIYQEDTDMKYRITLKGEKFCMTKSALFFHLENGVLKGYEINEDKALADQYLSFIRQNERRYIEKWGGKPHHEKYNIPYNTPINQ